MRGYTKLVSGVLFPLHEALKRHGSVRVRKRLEKSQWWSRDRIEAYQRGRLRRLLVHARERVPYYRDRFKEIGFDPRALPTVSDVSALPFLTKPLVRENLERLKAENGGPFTLYNTGGSTGEPLQFYMGRDRVTHDVAAKWRATRWWGVDIGDPEIVVWGSPIELGAQDRIRELRDRLFRTRLLPAFEMNEARLDGFVGTIERVRPKMLFGYPSSLLLIAQHARSRGRDLSRLGVEVVFVTAEQLYEHQREALGEAYGSAVANGYGGRDLGFVAHECPDGGLHVSAEDVFVEIVDEAGEPVSLGQTGEIVVTHLATKDFPFIRYRSGDLATWRKGGCSCGRGLPLLEGVLGRTTDFIVAKDGTVMHALALIYAVRDVPGVRSFKIVQESLDETRVLLVAEKGFPPSSEGSIRSRIEERLGPGVRVLVDRVESIPTTASGKHRYVESKVRPAVGDATERASGATAPAS